MRHMAAPTVGSTAPSVRRAARRATATSSPRAAPTGTGVRPSEERCSRQTSESARNRLATASIRSKKAWRSRAASTTTPGSVTTRSTRVDHADERWTAVRSGCPVVFVAVVMSSR